MLHYTVRRKKLPFRQLRKAVYRPFERHYCSNSIRITIDNVISTELRDVLSLLDIKFDANLRSAVDCEEMC